MLQSLSRWAWSSSLASLLLIFIPVAEATEEFFPQAILRASDGATEDRLGARSFAISRDGSTVLVPVLLSDCASGPDCGAVYVFVRAPEGWVQQAKLTGPDSVPGDRFTRAALSGDGNLALVGADNASCAAGAGCGAVYVFVRNGTNWSFQQKLTASDASSGDGFGINLALSGDGAVALVGAFGAPCGALTRCGAVYVFTRIGGNWMELQKLTGEPDDNNYFGGGLSLSKDGNTALIMGDFHGGAVAPHVYVFLQSGGAWKLQTRLAPFTSFSALLGGLSSDGKVAFFVEDSGQVIVHVYVRNGGGWVLESTLPVPMNGALGRSLAVSDDGQKVVVQSQRLCLFITNLCQAAHVFHRDQTNWILDQTVQFELHENGPVGLSGDGRTLLIGDPRAPCDSGFNCGVVHVLGAPSPLENVPTVSHLGLALLALLLALSGAWVLAARGRSNAWSGRNRW